MSPWENLLPKHGETFYFPRFFDRLESDRLFEGLMAEIPWRQEPIILFGKSVMQPRLTSWHGDDHPIRYSGITMTPNPWTDPLSEIKRRIEPFSGVQFTNALLNQYRDQRDSVGWHRDNEKELGREPIIGSVSFGSTRTFKLRHRHEKMLKTQIDLEHGSFLLMRGETQIHWEHCIPKRTRPIGPRINITFRILSHGF